MATVALLLALSNTLDAAEREILLRRTFWAVAWVESRGDPRAVNLREGAVGIVQIRMPVLIDVNRVFGYEKYKPEDRLNVQKCYEIFRCYCRLYANKGTPETMARLWNSGPDWEKKKHLTDKYWARVKVALDNLAIKR